MNRQTEAREPGKIERLTPEALNSFARDQDANADLPRVLGCVMAMPGITLGTALTVYLRANPAHCLEVPEALRTPEEAEMAEFLTELRDRINAGEYADDPSSPCKARALLVREYAVPAEELDRAPWLIDAGRVPEEIAREAAHRKRMAAKGAAQGAAAFAPLRPPEPVRRSRLSRLRKLLER